MMVKITPKGFSVELSGGEAMVLLEELGSIPAKGRIKVRQFHKELENALSWSNRGAVGHEGVSRADLANLRD